MIMSVFMALLVGLVLELILACLVDRPPPGDERATDPVSTCKVYCMLMLKIYTSMCLCKSPSKFDIVSMLMVILI